MSWRFLWLGGLRVNWLKEALISGCRCLLFFQLLLLCDNEDVKPLELLTPTILMRLQGVWVQEKF